MGRMLWIGAGSFGLVACTGLLGTFETDESATVTDAGGDADPRPMLDAQPPTDATTDGSDASSSGCGNTGETCCHLATPTSEVCRRTDGGPMSVCIGGRCALATPTANSGMCERGTSENGLCRPYVLAAVTNRVPAALALSATEVFFATNPSLNTNGSLQRVSKQNGDPAMGVSGVFESSTHAIRRVAANANFVFASMANSTSGMIRYTCIGTAPCTMPSPISVDPSVDGVAASGTMLLWGTSRQALVCPINTNPATCASVPFNALVQSQTSRVAMAGDDALAGGNAVLDLRYQGSVGPIIGENASAVALTNEYAAWVTAGRVRTCRFSRTGARCTPREEWQSTAIDIAIDGQMLFWIVRGTDNHGSVWQCNINDCKNTWTQRAYTELGATALAVDGGAIYFLTQAAGAAVVRKIVR